VRSLKRGNIRGEKTLKRGTIKGLIDIIVILKFVAFKY